MVCAPRSITTPSAPTADSFARASSPERAPSPCPKRVSPSQRYEFPTCPGCSPGPTCPRREAPGQVRASGDRPGRGVIIWRGALHPATRPTWYSSAAPRPSRPHWVSAGATATACRAGSPSQRTPTRLSRRDSAGVHQRDFVDVQSRSANIPPHQLRRWMSSRPASAAGSSHWPGRPSAAAAASRQGYHELHLAVDFGQVAWSQRSLAGANRKDGR